MKTFIWFDPLVFFVCKVVSDFAKFYIDDPSLSVCVSLASDSSETIEITVKLGTVTASDMLMHHLLTILTLTFIQDHSGLDHENKKCLNIISEIVQAIPIKFAVRAV